MIGRCVIVGVDDSAEARDAAVLGRRLAESAEGELHLVAAASHVLLDVLATRAGVDTDRLHESLIETAQEGARQALHEDFSDAELYQSLVARLGRAEHVLAEYGQEHGADAFVLGGTRHAIPSSWIQRGTAHHLLRVTDKPVLITGPDGPDVARLLAAVDRSPVAQATINTASALAQQFGLPLEIVHVIADPALAPELDLGLDSTSWIRAEEEEAERHLRPLLPDGSAFRRRYGDATAAIRSAAQEEPATLLVLGAHGKGRVHRLLFGSTTESLLADPPSSLAIVPAI